MCKKCGESIDHLLLHCEVAAELWSVLLMLFGVSWVMNQRVNNFFGSWKGQLGNYNALNIWRLAPLCLMWCLWRERNVSCFEDCGNGLLEMKMMLQSLYILRVALNSLLVSNFFFSFWIYILLFL
jgi:hypothetical protein